MKVRHFFKVASPRRQRCAAAKLTKLFTRLLGRRRSAAQSTHGCANSRPASYDEYRRA